MTSLKTLKKKWMGDPGFRAEYKAQKEELAVAAALIDARTKAHMTQEDVAKAMEYLAEADFITGQVLPVNGGYII